MNTPETPAIAPAELPPKQANILELEPIAAAETPVITPNKLPLKNPSIKSITKNLDLDSPDVSLEKFI